MTEVDIILYLSSFSANSYLFFSSSWLISRRLSSQPVLRYSVYLSYYDQLVTRSIYHLCLLDSLTEHSYLWVNIQIFSIFLCKELLSISCCANFGLFIFSTTGPTATATAAQTVLSNQQLTCSCSSSSHLHTSDCLRPPTSDECCTTSCPLWGNSLRNILCKLFCLSKKKKRFTNVKTSKYV